MMKEQMIISQRNELEKEIVHYIALFYSDFERKDRNYLDKALQKYEDYKTYGGYRPFTYFLDMVLRMKEPMIISHRNELEKEIIHYIELFYGDFESKDRNYLDKALQKYDDYKTYGGYRPFTYFVDMVLLKYKGGKI